jgi:hypothetical protein
MTIEAWNQPDGPGYGWAPCHGRKVELFFVFDKNGSRVGPGFKTRQEARDFVKRSREKGRKKAS